MFSRFIDWKTLLTKLKAFIEKENKHTLFDELVSLRLKDKHDYQTVWSLSLDDYFMLEKIIIIFFKNIISLFKDNCNLL